MYTSGDVAEQASIRSPLAQDGRFTATDPIGTGKWTSTGDPGVAVR